MLQSDLFIYLFWNAIIINMKLTDISEQKLLQSDTD